MGDLSFKEVQKIMQTQKKGNVQSQCEICDWGFQESAENWAHYFTYSYSRIRGHRKLPDLWHYSFLKRSTENIHSGIEQYIKYPLSYRTIQRTPTQLQNSTQNTHSAILVERYREYPLIYRTVKIIPTQLQISTENIHSATKQSH